MPLLPHKDGTMKTLLVLRDHTFAWMKEFFPDTHPVLVPLCNKPLLEYLIDFSIICGCTEIRIVLDGSGAEVEKYFGTGSSWGVPISYGSIRQNDALETILAKNSRFCADDSLLILDGFFFLRYDQTKDYSSLAHPDTSGLARTCATGSLVIQGHHPLDDDQQTMPLPLLEITPLATLNDLYHLAMDILEHTGSHYVLPGYSHENGVFIGRNVAIAKTAVITKPVMLGNNVQIRPGAEIGPGAIIGSNVIIGANSKTVRAMVMDHTYIGEELDLTNKIASGHMLISPENNISLKIEDAHLLSAINPPRPRRTMRIITHGITAFFLVLLMAVPYIFLSLILKYQKKWSCSSLTYLQNKDGAPLEIHRVELPSKGYAASLARALSVDKFELLFQIFTGKLRLIGNTLSPAEDMSPSLLQEFEEYAPGVFSYAEAEGWPAMDFDPEISDRFHMKHSTWTRDISMTFNALRNRLHTGKPS